MGRKSKRKEIYVCVGFPGGSMVKNQPEMQEIQVWSMGLEDPLEEGRASHSGILAWRIQWTEEPGRLHAVHGVAKSRTWLSDFTFTFHFHALEKEMATHSSVLAWRIPGMVEPGGLPSMGSHRVGHYWSDLAAAAAAEEPRELQSIGSQRVRQYWSDLVHTHAYVM